MEKKPYYVAENIYLDILKDIVTRCDTLSFKLDRFPK